jgi:hypothetical protein
MREGEVALLSRRKYEYGRRGIWPCVKKWRELLDSLILKKLVFDVPWQPRSEANQQLREQMDWNKEGEQKMFQLTYRQIKRLTMLSAPLTSFHRVPFP